MTRRRAVKVCPVPLCGSRIRRDQLMCRPCWFAAPKAIRAAVTRCWRRLRRERDIEAAVQYRVAADSAIGAAIRSRAIAK